VTENETLPLREPKISRWILLQVFLRSFLIQSTWNFERGLNYGFAFALAPILRKLYLKADQPRCFQRHLEYFNTQPYMASFILGAVARMEMEKAKVPLAEWRQKAEEINALKVGMMGPVAALGDSLFWATYRPFCGLLAAGLAFAGVFSVGRYAAMTTVVFFLVLFNAGHLGVRSLAFVQGWTRGDQVVLSLRKYGFQEATQGLRTTAAMILGVLLVLLNRPESERVAEFAFKMIFFGALLAFYTFALRKKAGPSQLFYGIVLFSLMLAYWPKLSSEPAVTGGFFPFISEP
jgi:PTS system mannose-specific IID component